MITTTWRDTVAVLEMNRPERRNALSSELCRALLAGLDEAEAGGARAVVLTGEGSSFCAGADLTILVGDDYLPLLVGMLRRVADFPVPVIAAVNGPALGAGTQLAVCCDLRVGAPDAVFGLPTAKLGAAAEAWTIRRLALVAGGSVARLMTLAGRRVDLAGALACGLVDEAGDLDAALALADEVAQLAPLSLRYSKRVLTEALEPPFEPAWVGEAVREAWLSEDFAEGKAAMAEKRPARFTGR
ncbi:enoyl-CoA hydratase [Rhodococcus aerolatus]